MATNFEFLPTPLPGLTLVERSQNADSRGFFSRLFCREQYSRYGFDNSIAQINHTLTTKKGAVRGLHFQHPPHSEIKIVSCVRGRIFDVAIDLRVDSSTYLHWHSEILSANNRRSLLIPKGFAHGFQTLTEDCELIYIHSHEYNIDSEGGLNVNDPAIGIAWPLAITEISAKDKSHAFIDSTFIGIKT